MASLASVVQFAISGASTRPFTSQRCRLALACFQGQRPVDWHGGSLFFTLQTADSLPHQRVALCDIRTRLYRSIFSFLVLHEAVLLATPPSAHYPPRHHLLPPTTPPASPPFTQPTIRESLCDTGHSIGRTRFACSKPLRRQSEVH